LQKPKGLEGKGSMDTKRLLLFSMLGFFVVVGFLISTSYSYNNSAPNFECFVCHSTVEPQKTTIKVAGVPRVYEPGKTYTITLTVESTLKSLGEVQGGFSAAASAGELVVTDAKNTQLSNGIMTHTQEGSNHRKWSFSWKAPAIKTDAEIKVMAVAANGDFSAANDAVTADLFMIKPAKR
jgi:hypothetical protein